MHIWWNFLDDNIYINSKSVFIGTTFYWQQPLQFKEEVNLLFGLFYNLHCKYCIELNVCSPYWFCYIWTCFNTYTWPLFCLTIFPGGGMKAPPPKIAHISGNFYGKCLNSFDFSWFGLTSNIKKELEHLSSRLFFMSVWNAVVQIFAF